MSLDKVVDSVVGGTRRGLSAAALVGTAVFLERGGRPLVKRALKGYLRGRELAAEAVERLQELSADASEQLQDIYAEVRAEVDEPLTEAESDPAAAPRPLHAKPVTRRSKP